MTQPRIEFKKMLDAVDPSASVYGQDPSNTSMQFPAIRYSHSAEDVKRADNLAYDIVDGYTVTVIEKDPSAPIAKKVRQLPYCSFNREYVADNMTHTVYTIYF